MANCLLAKMDRGFCLYFFCFFWVFLPFLAFLLFLDFGGCLGGLPLFDVCGFWCCDVLVGIAGLAAGVEPACLAASCSSCVSRRSGRPVLSSLFALLLFVVVTLVEVGVPPANQSVIRCLSPS